MSRMWRKLLTPFFTCKSSLILRRVFFRCVPQGSSRRSVPSQPRDQRPRGFGASGERTAARRGAPPGRGRRCRPRPRAGAGAAACTCGGSAEHAVRCLGRVCMYTAENSEVFNVTMNHAQSVLDSKRVLPDLTTSCCQITERSRQEVLRSITRFPNPNSLAVPSMPQENLHVKFTVCSDTHHCRQK